MKRSRTTISKAGPGGGKKVHRLIDMDVEFVSMVGAGANRQKEFQVVKEDDAAKAVPDADADNETKREAAQARASHYGIELRDDASLTYPADDPTTESLYGDPVNLKYPLGGTDNERDAGRIRNALARFSGAADEYEEMKSKVAVLSRIIEAALAEDISVTYQEDDDVYEALPADLKERIKEKAEADKDGGDDNADGNGTTLEGDDLSSWLKDAGEHVETLSLDIAVQNALDAQADGDANDDAASKEAQEIDTTAAPPVEKVGEEAGNDVQDVRDAKIAKLEAELKKARREITAMKAKVARLSKGVGKSSVIQTGEVGAKDGQPAHAEKTSPSRGAFATGGDIAAAVARD